MLKGCENSTNIQLNQERCKQGRLWPSTGWIERGLLAQECPLEERSGSWANGISIRMRLPGTHQVVNSFGSSVYKSILWELNVKVEEASIKSHYTES